MKMNKDLTSTAFSAKAHAADLTAPPAAAESTVPAQKRGFKPRWLRLQRRERKLREARALALRPVVG
jgi:hypothetical protein